MALMFDPDGIGFYDTGTGALGLPRGTTAQRPRNPKPGYMRYNTELQMVEIFGNSANTINANSWGTFLQGDYYAKVLVVGGGGSGSGPGGGAGGLVYASSMLFSSGTNYPVVVGAGGGGGYAGSYSSIQGITAFGGGGPGQIGGSGGGHWWNGHGQWGAHIPGTTGQGNPGGCGYCNHDWGHSYGGGGGAGGGGSNGASGPGGQSGNGGTGLPYTISGVNTYYAGGGAGGQGSRSWYGNSVPGGGGGHNGGLKGGTNQGGGGCNDAGGSGIVIIQYDGQPRAVGGSIAWYPDQYQTPGSGFTTHTFTTTDYYRA